MFYADHQPRCPAGHHKVSVINLPSRSTTLTCRHTELIHLYYTQLKPKYQLEFRVISKGFAASSHIFQTYCFYHEITNTMAVFLYIAGQRKTAGKNSCGFYFLILFTFYFLLASEQIPALIASLIPVQVFSPSITVGCIGLEPPNFVLASSFKITR